jgi:hypothetical protein
MKQYTTHLYEAVVAVDAAIAFTHSMSGIATETPYHIIFCYFFIKSLSTFTSITPTLSFLYQ